MRAVRVLLTDPLIRNLVAEGTAQPDHQDTHCKGLTLRVSARGTATFCVRSTGPDGRKRFVKLGNWPALSLKMRGSRRRA